MLTIVATASAAVGASTQDIYYPHGLKTVGNGVAIEEALRRLGTKFEEHPLEKSLFVKPKSVMYELDGKPRRWDVIESHSSVGVVLYHRGMDAFLLVRQFRPAVYVTAAREARARGGPEPAVAEGFTFELCAGILDKSKSLEEVAKEEIEEECGYRVPLSGIRRITQAISATGTSGAVHHQYFAEVDESMRVAAGGGLAEHGELIEVLALPFSSTPTFVLDSALPKSPGAMFGLLWAYHGLLSGELGSRKAACTSGSSSGLMTEELVLKPVLPA